MIARVQNSISLRFGLFHQWKSKNIYSKKLLKDKYDSHHLDQQLKSLAYKNIAAKKTARRGFIPGTSIFRDFTRRNGRSLNPKISINTAVFDILLQDTYWKKRWKIKPHYQQIQHKYKFMFYVLRATAMAILKKRLYRGLGRIFNIDPADAQYNIIYFSYKYSSASFLSNYFTRRLVLKFSLREVILPYLRRHRKLVTAILVGCYGRFTRRQRSHKIKFKFGKIPLNTFAAPIDYKKQYCKLKYGVGGIRVWVSQFFRTIKGTIKHYKQTKYISSQRSVKKFVLPIPFVQRLKNQRKKVRKITKLLKRANNQVIFQKRHFSTFIELIENNFVETENCTKNLIKSLSSIKKAKKKNLEEILEEKKEVKNIKKIYKKKLKLNLLYKNKKNFPQITFRIFNTRILDAKKIKLRNKLLTRYIKTRKIFKNKKIKIYSRYLALRNKKKKKICNNIS